MGNGWIKLHRKIVYSAVFKNPRLLKLWIYLLTKANHQDKEYMNDGGIILIKAGQLLTGRDQLSSELNIPPTTLERLLKQLESGHQIGQRKTTKYRVITILNWVEHQKTDSVSDNKRTTNGHKQELKNVKKETTGSKFQVVAMPDEDKPQREKKERVIPLPYSWEKTRDAWRVESRRYLRVLGWYLSRKDLWPTLTSEGRVSATLARLKGIAVKIAEGEWTSDELNAAYERIAANPKLSTEWTLETVEKYLTK